MNDQDVANGTGRISIGDSTSERDGILWQRRSREFGVQGFQLSLQWQVGSTVTVGSSLGLTNFEFYVRDWN